MNVETLLKDVFTEHEHLAPDADQVMAATQQRLARGKPGLVRPVGVAATVAVVVATAGGAVLLSRHSTGHPSPQRPTAGHSNVPPADQSTSGIAPLTMPYDLGWLPDGSVSYLARRINVGGLNESSPPVFDGEYMLTDTIGAGTVMIDVQQFPGGLADVAFKSGPGASVTIDGRDAVESSNSAGPGGYEVYFEDAAGGLMYVNVAADIGSTVPAAQLISIGRAVAENIHFPGSAEVQPSFGIDYLPDGLHVRAFDVESGDSAAPMADGSSGPSTSYDIGTAANQQSAVMVGTATAVPQGTTPGRDVQGHATRYADDNGWRSVYVLDAVHGQDVQLSGTLSEDELYKIADGLVLPS